MRAAGRAGRWGTDLEVEPVEHVADALTDAAEGVADALADRAETLPDALEPTTEQHAHEHPLHGAEGAVVAHRVGLVGAATLPVGHPARADHDLADVGFGASFDPLRVELARGDVALGAAGRRVGDVDHREAVPCVEEARRPAGRQGQAVDPGAHAGHGVAAVLEDLGDVPDLLGLGEVVGSVLGRLVGVEGPLVVGVGALGQLAAGHLGVEVLQLDAEGGDVLVDQPLDRGQLGGLLLDRTALAGARHEHDAADGGHDDDDQEDVLHGDSVRPSGNPFSALRSPK